MLIEVYARKVDTDSDNDFSNHHRRRVAPRRIDEMRDLVVNIPQSLKPMFDMFVIHVSRSNLAINNLDMFLSKDTKPDAYALQTEMEVNSLITAPNPDAKRMVDLTRKGS